MSWRQIRWLPRSITRELDGRVSFYVDSISTDSSEGVSCGIGPEPLSAARVSSRGTVMKAMAARPLARRARKQRPDANAIKEVRAEWHKATGRQIVE